MSDLATERRQGHHSLVDEEIQRIVMTILADIREDVRMIREELVEDDGEEEEEDLG